MKLPLLSRTLGVTFPSIILLPMYIPLTPNSWDPIYDAITSYPAVPFHLIIDPWDGPGNTTIGSIPSSDYISRISQLNTYNNTKLLGYVYTEYFNPSVVGWDMVTNMSVYSQWKNYAGADIHMDGIFFDEVPSVTNGTVIDYYTFHANVAKEYFGFGEVVLNCGYLPDNDFFGISKVDYFLIWEQTGAEWASEDALSLIEAKYNQTERAKSVVMIYDYEGNPSGMLPLEQNILQDLAAIGGLFLTSGEYITVGTWWDYFVRDVWGITQGLVI